MRSTSIRCIALTLDSDPNSSNPNKDAGKETRVLQSLLLDNILKLKTLQQLEHQSQQKHAHARHRTPSDQPASAFSPANVGQTEKQESACEEASDDESQAQTPRMAEHLPFWRRRCSDVYRDMNLSSPDQESYQEEHEAAGDGPHANEDGDLLLYQPSTSQLILDVVHSRLRDAGSRDAIVWRGDRVGQAVRSLLEEYIYVDAVGTDEHISPLEEKVSGQNTIPRSSPEVAQAHYPYGSEPPFWEHRSTIDVADSDASPTRHEQRRNMKPTESDRVHGIDLQTVFGQGEASCGKHRTREKRRQSGTFISSDDTTNSSGSDIRRDMPLDADHGRTSRFKIQNNHDQDQRVNSRHFARRRKCEVRLASDRRTHELDHTLAFLEAIANRVASPYNEVLRTKAKYKTLKHEVVLERAIAQAKKDTLDAVKAERGNRSESHHRRGESERVTLKDFLGRTFTLPVQSCDTWQNMQELIASTFEKGDPRRDEIESGKYDLLESSGEVILPAVWAALVQSGMTVELRIRSLEAQELGRTTNGRKRGGPIETPTSHSLSDGVVVGGESPRSSRRRLSAAKDWFGRKVSPREREIGTASFPAADL